MASSNGLLFVQSIALKQATFVSASPRREYDHRDERVPIRRVCRNVPRGDRPGPGRCWRSVGWPVTPRRCPISSPRSISRSRPCAHKSRVPSRGKTQACRSCAGCSPRWARPLPRYARSTPSLRGRSASLTLRAADVAPFMLSGHRAFTHTCSSALVRLEVLPSAAPCSVARLARAVGIGLAFSLLSLCLGSYRLPAWVRAFSTAAGPRVAHLRRGARPSTATGSIPGHALFSLVWALPSDPTRLVEIRCSACRMLPRILILVPCHTMARYFGASGFGALSCR